MLVNWTLELIAKVGLSPDEAPQYQSKTAKLVYTPRKQGKSLIKIKKIRKITTIQALSG